MRLKMMDNKYNIDIDKNLKITNQIDTKTVEQLYKHSPDELKKVAKLSETVLREYNAALVRNHIGLSRAELMKQNIIDARALFDKPDNKHDLPDIRYIKNKEKISDYIENADWLSCIPCFEEGVLQVNEDRFFYWKILNVNAEKKSYTIFIQDYGVQIPGVWEVGVAICADILSNDEFDKSKRNIILNNDYDEYFSANFTAIYRCLNLKKELKWNKQKRDIWKKYIIKHAEQIDNDLKENKTTSFISLARAFCHIICYVNASLKTNKVSKPIHRKTITEKTVIKKEQKPTPERVVRTVGTVIVKSKKPPRIPTEKTVIKYVIASWPTRGHIRHYKSGKTVYIKPTVHKRKCLQNENKETKQTIVFKNNIKKEKTE